HDQTPLLQSPLPNLPISKQQNNTALDIDTQSLYSPSQSMQQIHFINNNVTQQGDILRDLGISSTQNLLVSNATAAPQKAFIEQSPLDILDEYLEQDNLSERDECYEPQ